MSAQLATEANRTRTASAAQAVAFSGSRHDEERLQEKSRALGYGDFGAEVDVLDGVEKLDAFLHRALESFTARDQAGAAGALVDHRRGHRFFEIVRAGSPTTVDQARAAHVAIRDLVAAQVDGMIAAELGIDAFVEFAVT